MANEIALRTALVKAAPVREAGEKSIPVTQWLLKYDKYFYGVLGLG